MNEPVKDQATNALDYYFSFLNKNLTITELFDECLEEIKLNMSDTNAKNTKTEEAAHSANEDREYYVEEPFDQFDYIFEPEHYSKKATREAVKETGHSNLIDTISENKFTHARIIRDNDGLLEYEYQSYTYVNKNLDTSKPKRENIGDDFELFFNDFDFTTHNHLNAIIRGISLSKWPKVGFGFNLSKQSIDDEIILYVSNIVSNSPAEFSLQLGDILLEFDDINTAEKEIDDIVKYIEAKENSLHLMVIHESKYFQLKSMENGDVLKNFRKNCEDIVIVS
jgi:hypothetical protein